MDSGPSNDDFDDELLSAYVDGEVTAAERAAVEARLAADPQAARLVTALRSLSKAVKSLPRERLGHDLRLLVEADIEEARSAAAAEIVPVTPPYDRWAGLRRGMLWSAVAIAATIALVMLTPEETGVDERKVAQVDVTKKANKDENQGAAGKDSPPRGMMGSMRAAGGPENSPSNADQPAAAGGGMPAPAGGSAGAPIAAPDEAKKQANAEELPREQARRSLDRIELGKAVTDAEAASATAEPGAAKQKMAASDEAATKPLGFSFKREDLADAAPEDRQRELAEAAGAPAQVVELDVKAPEAIARFEQLLKQQDIQLLDEQEAPAQFKSRKKGDAPQGPQSESADKIAEKIPQLRDSSNVGADATSHSAVEAESALKELAGGESSAAGAGEERVIVEATPQQIERLYAACVAANDFFAVMAPLNGAKPGQANRAPGAGTMPAKPTAGGFGGGIGGLAEKRDQDKTASGLAADTAQQTAKNGSGKDAAPAPRSSGSPSSAVAWRLPSVHLGISESFGLETNGKLADAKDERLSSAAEPSGPQQAPPLDAAAGTPFRSSADRLSKTRGAAEEGKVQVLFVLRRRPTSEAASPAAPAPPATVPAKAEP
jgi:anti-sigma factor RsiW